MKLHALAIKMCGDGRDAIHVRLGFVRSDFEDPDVEQIDTEQFVFQIRRQDRD